jgi:hypothetical protein
MKKLLISTLVMMISASVFADGPLGGLENRIKNKGSKNKVVKVTVSKPDPELARRRAGAKKRFQEERKANPKRNKGKGFNGMSDEEEED